MVWNEEEAKKSYLFGDLNPLRTTIDFGRRICQNRVHISKNQEVQPTGGQTSKSHQATPDWRRRRAVGTRLLPHFRNRTGASVSVL